MDDFWRNFYKADGQNIHSLVVKINELIPTHKRFEAEHNFHLFNTVQRLQIIKSDALHKRVPIFVFMLRGPQ
ncbi:hypothetical protein T02_7118 [Trichinella nativa]|uniref:Uncharacterized protein n=1 Tax=Trichinella nativa TaxID=6335 RepID=A0A0V1KLL2_9BILA|nr:hypothetical protein T02_7118 [Trichinella nativa]